MKSDNLYGYVMNHEVVKKTLAFYDTLCISHEIIFVCFTSVFRTCMDINPERGTKVSQDNVQKEGNVCEPTCLHTNQKAA